MRQAEGETGTIVAIEGSVVDVRLEGRLPAIRTNLRRASQPELIDEVLESVSLDRIRGLALNPELRVGLGMSMRATGDTSNVPVGEQIAVLLAVTTGLLGTVPIEPMAPAEQAIRSRARAELGG